MKMLRLTLIMCLSVLFTAGCGPSEPDYSDFYKIEKEETDSDDDDDEDGDDDDDDDGGGEIDPDPALYTLKLISFNVRYENDDDTGDRSWSVRKTAVKAMMADQQPDLMGVQEPRLAQKTYMDANFAGYKSVGVGRNNGTANDPTGEFMAIYYRTESMELGSWGTFWLSETPGVASTGWGATIKRTATWAILTHKESGRKLFMLNTHLDHATPAARTGSMVLIENKLEELNPNGYPVVMTGDFNTTIGDAIFNNIKLTLEIARTTAPQTDYLNSYNAWGGSGMIIDHIFYSGFTAMTFWTIMQKYENVTYISDHYPIAAELQFKNE